MSWMGIDIGTSGCKAVVFDSQGRVLASASREYQTLMPQAGWAELDSAAVIEACVAVLAEAAGRCLHADAVTGIGVTCQGEAFTALGPTGAILNNAMVSFDTRAAALAQSWPAQFGARRLYELTGHTAHPMFTLFKILWLREHRPDVWETAQRFY